MARKTSHQSGRDAIVVARPFSPELGLLRSALRPISVSRVLDSFEDRRLWHPERQARPFTAAPRSAARIVAKQRPAFKTPSQTKGILAFAEPSKVWACARRKARKEIMHALHIAGGSGFKKRRYNGSSKYSCR